MESKHWQNLESPIIGNYRVHWSSDPSFSWWIAYKNTVFLLVDGYVYSGQVEPVTGPADIMYKNKPVHIELLNTGEAEHYRLVGEDGKWIAPLTKCTLETNVRITNVVLLHLARKINRPF